MLNVGSSQPAELDSTPAAISQDDFSNDDIEEAIRVSVRETSRGDPEEDAAVERAIRASMAELQRSRDESAQLQQADAEQEDDEDLKRALQASAAEAQQGQGHQNPLYDAELEQALAQSLKEQRQQRSDEMPAIQIQDHSDAPADPPAYDPGHLGGTTQHEYEAQQAAQPGEKTQQEKTEEQVVMEYVKKQSMLETEHRKGKAPQRDEDDEELKKAMEESMRGQGQQGEASGTSQ